MRWAVQKTKQWGVCVQTQPVTFELSAISSWCQLWWQAWVHYIGEMMLIIKEFQKEQSAESSVHAHNKNFCFFLFVCFFSCRIYLFLYSKLNTHRRIENSHISSLCKLFSKLYQRGVCNWTWCYTGCID